MTNRIGRWHRSVLLQGKATRTSFWLLGTFSVGAAVLSSLVVAVALGFVLMTARGGFQRAQRVQSILTQTMLLQEDLKNADSAVRELDDNFNTPDMQRFTAKRDSAKMRVRSLAGLMQASAADAALWHRSAALIDAGLDNLTSEATGNQRGKMRRASVGNSTRLPETVATGLDDLYMRQTEELRRRLAAADHSLVQAFALALIGVLFAPAFGVGGMLMLRHERDTRRLRDMQKDMMQVQRLAVMGETAAMLAHDVSHPLTAANNYLGALRRLANNTQFEDRERIADLATRAAAQIHRASVILLRLRRFIEKREAERVREEPAVLVQEAIALLGPLDSGTKLRVEIEPALPQVSIDRVQIQQVLVNLMRNAVEAMQNASRRDLTVSASGQGGHCVLFSLADSGCGLSREVAERLFRPFVSSKREGMGVGLSICRSIVLEHGGTIWAEPNPGGGTVFRFRLPVAPEA